MISLLIFLSCVKNEEEIVIKESQIKPNIQEKNDELIEFNQDLHNIIYSKEQDYTKGISNFIDIYTKYSKSNNSEIIKEQWRLKRHIYEKCKFTKKTDLISLQNLLEITTPDDDKEVLYYCLFVSNASRGNIQEAEIYGNNLLTTNPNSEFVKEPFPQILEKVISANKELVELSYLDVKEDEELFLLGEIYARFCRRNNIFRRFVLYDLSLAKDIFNSLIDRFPNSTFADNAAYFILNNKRLCEDGDYIPEMAEEYESFIRKYPDSELNARVYLHICFLSFPYKPSENKHKNNINVLQKNKSNIARFINDYPTYKGIQEVYPLMKRINDKLGINYSFNISSNKDTIKIGESININFVLKNLGQEDLTFYKNRNDDINNFAISITKYPSLNPRVKRTDSVEFMLCEKFKSETIMVTIRKDKAYLETIDLKDKVRNNFNNDLGYFDISKPSLYKIYGLVSMNGKTVDTVSNAIWLVVEE